MIPTHMLPILHLRRQAHTLGWRRDSYSKAEGFRTWKWTNPHPWDGGSAVFQAEVSDGDGGVFFADTFTADTTCGLITLDRISVNRLPATLRAHMGWVEPADLAAAR